MKNSKTSQFFFCFGQILFTLIHTFAGHHEKSFVLVKVSIDHLFDNLESGKSLEFWIQNLIFTNRD